MLDGSLVVDAVDKKVPILSHEARQELKLIKIMLDKRACLRDCQSALNDISDLNQQLVEERKYLQINRVLSQFIYSLSCIILHLTDKSGVDFEAILFRDSIYQSLNRYFLLDIFIALELEIKNILISNKFNNITSGMGRKYKLLLDELETASNNSPQLLASIVKLRKFTKKNAEFDDYFNYLLKNLRNENDTYLKDSRLFIDALKIVRNKLSHSDLSLTDTQRMTLHKSPLNKMVGENNTLLASVIFCPVIARNIILFLKVADARINRVG